MTDSEIIEKPLPALRLAALTVRVATQPEVVGQVGPLFDRVADALTAVGASLSTPVAVYEMDEHGVRITAGYVSDDPAPDGLTIVELPAAASAVSLTHLGVMATIGLSWSAVFEAITERGARAEGPCREVYLRAESEDQVDWITELQQPIARG